MLGRILRRKEFVDPAPTLADVAYGNDCKRQVLDFWAGSGQANAPALVFFHGGGFVLGSKYFCRQMREIRERGGAVISVNYRFVRRRGETVARSMDDGRRAIGFIREQADRWKIDPERIALHGKSSGGCIALWAAMKETVRGVTTHNTPTTLDPHYLATFGKCPVEFFLPIWGPMGDTWRASDLDKPRIRKLVETYSPLHNVHAGSPPLYLHYTADQPAGRIGWLHTLHCLGYGDLMKDRYDELGLSCEIACPSRPPKRDALGFLCDVLGLPHEVVTAPQS